jgi:L-methionine (R)-S-oxide reductase
MKISFTEILTSGRTKVEKARSIAEKIREMKGYSWIGIYDVKEKEIRIISWAGRTEPVFGFFPKDKGLNGRAVMMKQTIIVNDTDKDEDYLLTFSNTKSEIIAPVFGSNEQIVGTIDVESKTKNAFGKEDADFLEDCAKGIVSLWSKS